LSAGWYPRRRGAGDHLATGEISLFDDGVHDFLCMNAQSRIDPTSKVPPGVWLGSARKIWLLTRRQGTERAIQRSLQKLERLGWIKRFRTPEQSGDYPILIAKFVVTGRAPERFLVNAKDTVDWRYPKLDLCTAPGTGLSPFLQELEKRDKRPRPATQRSEVSIQLLKTYGVTGLPA
jgi:hypothetical protein